MKVTIKFKFEVKMAIKLAFCFPRDCSSSSQKKIILLLFFPFASKHFHLVKEALELTLGMESMFDKVWRLLAEDEVRIMGLYGYGGVGKTTLLKQINNAFLKSTTSSRSSSSSLHGFDVVILVVVSKALNIDAIQKEIGNRLELLSLDRTSIFNALTKKNFVLLLDDIWETIDLQSIGIPPSHENTKSKVVFTTRSETVCRLMEANEMLKVECLPWNKAWSLFQEKVGERALNSFPRAREVAKDVARECGGLPLALVTIGRAMSTKKSVEEWNHTLTTLRETASDFPGMSEEVLLPLLKPSYDSLRDNTVKSCFLYCALFPEDTSIDKTKLIDYWIGEGLILLNEFDHIDEARNHGYDVIGNLKGACLLESGKYEETQVKMHDTIRDLALWIAHECGSKRETICIIETPDLTAGRSWYNAGRIYLRPPHHNGETKLVQPPLPPPLQSPSLITLIHHHFCYRFRYRDLSVLPQNFFEFTPLLRVLDLSRSNMETFPISITELLELRYLSLSWTNIQELPEELRKLVKLKFLDLSHMLCLRTIPSRVIASLLELRVLNLFDSYQVYWDLEEGYNLKHLNDLHIMVNTQQSLNKLLSNQNLQMCTRNLTLMKPKPFLVRRSEDKPKSTSSSPVITLEKLQLLFNLETLRLVHFLKAELINLGSCCQNLSRIEISNCNALKDLTWVGYVPNLRTLYVYDCKDLEEIVIVVDEISSMMSNIEDVFKRLKTLSLIHLPKLKSICNHALAFPCLESMEVSKCPQLKKLPFDSGSNVNNTLQRISGGPKWWSELQWEEEEEAEAEEDNNNNSNNNSNNNNSLLKSKFIPYFIERSYMDYSISRISHLFS